jgi:integrase
MRLKDYAERDGKRVWLSESEIGLLLEETDTDHVEMDMAFNLAARCGLRRAEIVEITPADLVTNDTGQVVRVWEGKGDKYREVPAPARLTQLALGLGKDPDESLVECDPSTVYDWVSRARARARAKTGEQGWQFVGPHDLRRSWGVRLLEAGVLPSVVMEWGGWEDWQTFRNHYLAEFSPEALRRERTKVGWLAEARSDADPAGSDQGYSVVGSGSNYGDRR